MLKTWYKVPRYLDNIGCWYIGIVDIQPYSPKQIGGTEIDIGQDVINYYGKRIEKLESLQSDDWRDCY